MNNEAEVKKYWKKLGYEEDFYRQHHGLHVIDNVCVDGCRPCEERARIIATAALTGEEIPKEVNWSP